MERRAALREILGVKEGDLRAMREAGEYAALLDEKRAAARAASPPLDFLAAVSGRGGGRGGRPRIIAEVKKASPSRGVIRPDFDPLSLALEYEENGAAALSVLTEERFFKGSMEYLSLIKGSVSLPVLRKDFILDGLQVYEARAAGADAVLLICAILDEVRLRELMDLAAGLSMTSLVEVHTRAELDMALGVGAGLIGINNRDLKTFRTDISVTERLVPLVPAGVTVVSESGINTPADIKRLMDAGVRAFLVGEALAREKDAGAKLRELMEAGK